VLDILPDRYVYQRCYVAECAGSQAFRPVTSTSSLRPDVFS